MILTIIDQFISFRILFFYGSNITDSPFELIQSESYGGKKNVGPEKIEVLEPDKYNGSNTHNLGSIL